MVDEPDPARLRALEAKLDKIRAKPALVRPQTVKGFSQGEVAWRMIIELCTGMVLGLGLGYGLDLLAGTLPVFLVLFAGAGFAAGVKTMLGTARAMNDAAAAARTED